jgi:hypothetical protein
MGRGGTRDPPSRRRVTTRLEPVRDYRAATVNLLAALGIDLHDYDKFVAWCLAEELVADLARGLEAYPLHHAQPLWDREDGFLLFRGQVRAATRRSDWSVQPDHVRAVLGVSRPNGSASPTNARLAGLMAFLDGPLTTGNGEQSRAWPPRPQTERQLLRRRLRASPRHPPAQSAGSRVVPGAAP